MKRLAALILSAGAITVPTLVAGALPAGAQGSPNACLGYTYAIIHLELHPGATAGYNKALDLYQSNGCTT